jgi:hypothetical protein
MFNPAHCPTTHSGYSQSGPWVCGGSAAVHPPIMLSSLTHSSLSPWMSDRQLMYLSTWGCVPRIEFHIHFTNHHCMACRPCTLQPYELQPKQCCIDTTQATTTAAPLYITFSSTAFSFYLMLFNSFLDLLMQHNPWHFRTTTDPKTKQNTNQFKPMTRTRKGFHTHTTHKNPYPNTLEPIPISTGMGFMQVWVWIGVELPMGYLWCALVTCYLPSYPHCTYACPLHDFLIYQLFSVGIGATISPFRPIFL